MRAEHDRTVDVDKPLRKPYGAGEESIYLIPAKYVTPFDTSQARRVIQGEESEELEKCLEEAYAVHYFANSWS